MTLPSLVRAGQREAQLGRRGFDLRVELGEARRHDAVVSVGVEQGGAQAAVGEAIDQLAREPRDESVQPQSSQIIGGPARSI